MRIYRVYEGKDPSEKSVELLREQEKFSKYRVEQLAIVKEAGTLIALSNGFISTYDVSTYEIQDTFARSKGASTFAVTSNIIKDQGIPLIVSRLAVAVKRRLLLWTWQDSELVNEEKEIVLASGIKTLTWATATRLVVGLGSNYVLVNVETSAIIDISGPGSIGGGSASDTGRFGGAGVASLGYMGMGGMVPRPLATRLAEGELLLAKDINTHFIDTNGKSLEKRQIPWAVAPEAIGYSYPFILSLNSTKGTLEIRNPESLTLLQSIALPNATQLYIPNPHISLAHAGKGFLVASDRCIWRLDALGYDAQIEALVEKHRYDEALSLLGLLEDSLLTEKEPRMREIRISKAQELFEHKKYRNSMDLFIQAHAPPERVITLYPTAISGDLQSLLDDMETSTLDLKESSQSELSLSKTGSDISKSHATESVTGKKDSASIPSTRTSTLTKSGRDMEGKELQTAISELCGFLVDSRTMLQRFISFEGTLKGKDSIVVNGTEVSPFDILLPPKPENDSILEERLKETAKIVDTTLFRAYMLAQPSMAGPLFRLPNFCDANVVREKLLESKRYNDIIDFLYGKRLHKEALDLLQSLAEQKHREELPEPLQNSQRIVAYLQTLSKEHLDLILEYARRPLETDPELGMEIFLADTENAESLPRDKVLSFLKTIDPKLAARYLEHIILELTDDTADFHKDLIEEYLGILKLVQGDEKVKEQKKLMDFLKSSKHYQSWKILPLLSKNGKILHCTSSNQLILSDPDVFEARAIVLGSMGEHRQALSIYVFDMIDTSKAEEYETCKLSFHYLTITDTAIMYISIVLLRQMSPRFGHQPPQTKYRHQSTTFCCPFTYHRRNLTHHNGIQRSNYWRSMVHDYQHLQHLTRYQKFLLYRNWNPTSKDEYELPILL